ncbi:hypothetical protein CLOM_g19497 [Closterium sp. NIES-68]|nr:hypothetical protein CLOM_g19497 [Closterium sp. NIES-68]
MAAKVGRGLAIAASCSRRKLAAASGGPIWLPKIRNPEAQKGIPGGRRPSGSSAWVRWAKAAVHAAGSPIRVMSSAYARQRTLGYAWAVSRRAGCMAAAKRRGPMGSPCRTPRALRRGGLLKPASRKRVEGAP